jgi:hypothetical protein
MTRWFGGESVCRCAREGSFPGGHVLAGGETGPLRCRCEDRGPKPAETLAASVSSGLYGSWKRKVKKEIPDQYIRA